MSQTLYIGGLDYSINNEGLAEAFAKAGSVVSAQVIMDRETGRSRGFGFVEMATEEDGQAAIEMFNGKELNGRRITVAVARPKEEHARPRRNFRS